MPTFETFIDSDAAGRQVLTVVGDVDLAAAPALLAAAEACLPGNGSAVDASTAQGAGLRLDLTGVTFLDSTGIGALIRIRRTAVESGAAFDVTGVSPAVERVLALAGISDLFAPAGSE